MKYILICSGLVISLSILVFSWLMVFQKPNASPVVRKSVASNAEAVSTANVLIPDTTFIAHLKNGKAEIEGDNLGGNVAVSRPYLSVSESKNPDIFAVVSVNFGGSGVFEYLGLFHYDNGGYTADSLGLLGDRVIVKSMILSQKYIPNKPYSVTVSYLDRTENESMADTPTKTVVVEFPVVHGTIGKPVVSQ